MLHQGSQSRIRRDPTSEDDVIDTAGPTCLDRLPRQHIGNSLLEAGRYVVDVSSTPLVSEARAQACHRRLQPGEGEIEGVFGIVHQCSRKFVRPGIALAGGSIDVRAAREWQTEKTCHFVECFARGIVQCLPQRLNVVTFHQDERRMTSRDQQCNDRIRQLPVLHLIHGNVGREMIHPIEINADASG